MVKLLASLTLQRMATFSARLTRSPPVLNLRSQTLLTISGAGLAERLLITPPLDQLPDLILRLLVVICIWTAHQP